MSYNTWDLAYLNSIGGIGNLGAVGTPFPEWYTDKIAKSTNSLSPSGAVTAFANVKTPTEAANYAKASWSATLKLDSVIKVRREFWHKALQRYRFVSDLAAWGNRVGVSSDEFAAFTKHLKDKILSGDEALKEAKAANGIGPATVAPAPIVPGPVSVDTSAPIIGPVSPPSVVSGDKIFGLNKWIVYGGATVIALGVALSLKRK